MSRTGRFIGGIGFGYANQVLVTLVGLWLTPFLLARVGQGEYGLWLVGTQILAYLLLADFGVVALLPRETAFAAGRAAETGRREDLAALTGQTATLVLWQMPVVAAAACAVWVWLPAEWEPLRGPLGVVLLAFVLTFPLRIFSAVLQGLQDLAFLAKANMCVWLAGTAVAVGMVFAGRGLYALAAGWVVTQTLAAPVLAYRLGTRFADALPRRPHALPWAAARERLGRGFWASLTQVAQALMFGTDLLVIGKLLGPEAVVPYACTAKLVLVLANQPQVLMQSAMPALSELRGGGERERLARVSVALAQAMLLVSGAVACVVLATNRGFVTWWVGGERFGGALLTALFVAAMMLRHWRLTVGYILFSFRHDRLIAVTSLAEGVLTAAALVAFTRWLGATGAPLALVAGTCLVGVPVYLRALALSGAVSVGGLLRSLAPWFWRFAAVAAASGVVGRVTTQDSLPAVAAAALAVALVYLAVMLPVALREPLGTYVRPRLAALAGRFGKSRLVDAA